MPAPAVVIFDVNETLSDLEPLRGRFERIGAPAAMLDAWFAATLRDGFALTRRRLRRLPRRRARRAARERPAHTLRGRLFGVGADAALYGADRVEDDGRASGFGGGRAVNPVRRCGKACASGRPERDGDE